MTEIQIAYLYWFVVFILLFFWLVWWLKPILRALKWEYTKSELDYYENNRMAEIKRQETEESIKKENLEKFVEKELLKENIEKYNFYLQEREWNLFYMLLWLILFLLLRFFADTSVVQNLNISSKTNYWWISFILLVLIFAFVTIVENLNWENSNRPIKIKDKFWYIDNIFYTNSSFVKNFLIVINNIWYITKWLLKLILAWISIYLFINFLKSLDIKSLLVIIVILLLVSKK